jgi:hypothetical protein
MANVKISGLPTITGTLTGTEILPIVSSGTTYSATTAEVAALATPGITDAPSDGTLYERQDAAWVASTWQASTWTNTAAGISDKPVIQSIINGSPGMFAVGQLQSGIISYDVVLGYCQCTIPYWSAPAYAALFGVMSTDPTSSIIPFASIGTDGSINTTGSVNTASTAGQGATLQPNGSPWACPINSYPLLTENGFVSSDVNGNYWSVNGQSVMVFSPQSTPPTAVAGGMYFDGTNFHASVDGTSWKTITLT